MDPFVAKNFDELLDTVLEFRRIQRAGPFSLIPRAIFDKLRPLSPHSLQLFHYVIELHDLDREYEEIFAARQKVSPSPWLDAAKRGLLSQ